MAAKEKMADSDLEKKDYFHGYRPRKDIQHLLKEPNHFLVRVTDSHGQGYGDFVVSVMNEKKEILHLTLVHEDDKWKFMLMGQAGRGLRKKKSCPDVTKKRENRGYAGFNTIVELVDYYREHKTPGKTYLKHIVPRPKWQITHDLVDYKTTDLIGRGNFCNVYHGKYKRTAGTTYDVAIKVCHEGKLTETNEESKEARKAMIAEAERMSIYVDDFIVQLHGVALARPPILIVMEYCAGGNLEAHLKKNPGEKIEAGERVVYALEAAKGMRYLHDNSCIHRDLAARNCLISADGVIKIGDFGLSLNELDKTGKDEEEPETNTQIPLRWMAPESLRRPAKYSAKTDVWSFGVLLYEIFAGEKPWPDEPFKKIATWIRRCQMPPMPSNSPKRIVEMTSKIWVATEEDRPSMNKLFKQLYTIRKEIKPPADVKLWAISTIPGVKRSRIDVVNLGASEAEALSKDISLPTTENTIIQSEVDPKKTA